MMSVVVMFEELKSLLPNSSSSDISISLLHLSHVFLPVKKGSWWHHAHLGFGWRVVLCIVLSLEQNLLEKAASVEHIHLWCVVTVLHRRQRTLEVLHLHMAFPVVVNILPCLTGCQIRSMFSATPPKGISRVMILPMLRSELDTCPSLTKIWQ